MDTSGFQKVHYLDKTIIQMPIIQVLHMSDVVSLSFKSMIKPCHKMVVVSFEVDDPSRLIQGDTPEDVVKSGVGRDPRDDGSERVDKVGTESVDLFETKNVRQFIFGWFWIINVFLSLNKKFYHS